VKNVFTIVVSMKKRLGLNMVMDVLNNITNALKVIKIISF
jgi:hypothetical protein